MEAARQAKSTVNRRLHIPILLIDLGSPEQREVVLNTAFARSTDQQTQESHFWFRTNGGLEFTLTRKRVAGWLPPAKRQPQREAGQPPTKKGRGSSWGTLPGFTSA